VNWVLPDRLWEKLKWSDKSLVFLFCEIIMGKILDNVSDASQEIKKNYEFNSGEFLDKFTTGSKTNIINCTA